MTPTLLLGDCLAVMPTLAAESVDSIVTDPPYGLSFMGKDWDHGIPGVHFWTEALRVAKPGAHLLAFGGTRTFHRLTCAIEDAGWEIRDCVMWVYGSGFPKSHNVSVAIDKEAGAVREVVGNYGRSFRPHADSGNDGWLRPSHEVHGDITSPATPEARQWEGWGTALKPAWEPVIVARKPLAGTVAQNVLRYGTGGLNIDACRVGTESTIRNSNAGTNGEGWGFGKSEHVNGSARGRWPANLIHDGSPEVVSGFHDRDGAPRVMGDTGSAARFFYCAKASKADREGSTHPTMKPTALMRYLCRMVTPPGGVVLDPFMGSGSTGKAAALDGFRFVGIEMQPEYLEIARARIAHAAAERARETEQLTFT